MGEQSSRYDDIKALIEKHGPLGVSEIAKHLDAPLSTIHKYLTIQQDYFKQGKNKKWLLPDESDIEESATVANNMAIVLKSQVKGINALVELLMSQLNSATTLMSDFQPIVRIDKVSAEKDGEIHPYIVIIDKKIKTMYDLYQKHVPICPEEYRELLINLDLVKLTTDMGLIYMFKDFNVALSYIFTEKSDTLPDEIVDILKKYQIS